MESVFNTITGILMVASGVVAIFSIPIIAIRSVVELLTRRSKPVVWYIKVWIIPIGAFALTFLMFGVRTLSPALWGKSTGGSVVVTSTVEKDGQVLSQEKRTTDFDIKFSKEEKYNN